MAKLSNKLRSLDMGNGKQGLAFFCPGCNDYHAICITPGNHPSWSWNNSADKPTFHPSVDVTSGHYMREYKPGDSCWCSYNKEHPEAAEDGFHCTKCHSFIKDGMIQFLTDSTHHLAGQTVPLGDLP